jgi:4-aminobutyrate aminotransferase / (S)-3-amino-2-methylpropionate transaminase / 5-aminovalerate transaminase
MTTTNISSPVNGIAQERNLVTAVPGPKSLAMLERRTAAVSAGVGSTLPIYIERAGGGVVVDIDGNSLIDMGSGIAVTGVGNAAEEVVARVQEQVAKFTKVT